MKYFIIHSGCDFDKFVKPLLCKWSELYSRAKFLVLTGGQDNWINDATAKIRQSEKVIFLVGQHSHESNNIDKEVEIALKEKKQIYIYKLSETFRVNDILSNHCGVSTKIVNGDVEGEYVFQQSNKVIYLNDNTLDYYIKSDNVEVEQELKSKNFENKETLMEQYKIFVKTSEDLVKRKQSVNSFYVTLNSVIIGAIISVLCAVNDIFKVIAPLYLSVMIAFIGGIGLIICFSWFSLLNSYADLNASKMKIIATIEENLALNLFETEWSLVTKRLGKKKYKSFSKKEKFVAILFSIIYILLVGTGILFACL